MYLYSYKQARADSSLSYCPGTLGGKHTLEHGTCVTCGVSASEISKLARYTLELAMVTHSYSHLHIYTYTRTHIHTSILIDETHKQHIFSHYPLSRPSSAINKGRAFSAMEKLEESEEDPEHSPSGSVTPTLLVQRKDAFVREISRALSRYDFPLLHCFGILLALTC
jgi:hypothetical protein